MNSGGNRQLIIGILIGLILGVLLACSCSGGRSKSSTQAVIPTTCA